MWHPMSLDIVEAVMPSIVSITNERILYQSFFRRNTDTAELRCTGIIVSQDGDNLYIATNNHVVEGQTAYSRIQ